MVEVAALKKQIVVFESKLTKAGRVLNKRRDELSTHETKISANKIFE